MKRFVTHPRNRKYRVKKVENVVSSDVIMDDVDTKDLTDCPDDTLLSEAACDYIGRRRQPQAKWFSSHRWLRISRQRKILLYSWCREMGKKRLVGACKVESVFIDKGFNNWKDGSQKLDEHAASSSHRAAADYLSAVTKVSKEPERMYKIVLAGDAAVGKSSFIVRLCKGKFVPNLSSTLGVDFQTKMLDVDGQPTALQLWDTAGQERFRSVARTYFRRADGVLLLYDVTYERSFLNLRDWVDAIEDGALKKVPIMLVGNKTDARPELEHQGRRVVKYDDGVRLSREINSLFIETSAKDGANITEAVIELTRLLRTNEDMEVKTVGMQLHDMKDKKSGSCCKRS